MGTVSDNVEKADEKYGAMTYAACRLDKNREIL